MTELERKVLEYVRAHPGLSGNRIAAQVTHRRRDVLGALRRLEGRGELCRSTVEGERFPGWFPARSHTATARSTPNRPRRQVYLADADLEELETLPLSARLQRKVERWRKAREAA